MFNRNYSDRSYSECLIGSFLPTNIDKDFRDIVQLKNISNNQMCNLLIDGQLKILYQ